jgi:hypothetical protein
MTSVVARRRATAALVTALLPATSLAAQPRPASTAIAVATAKNSGPVQA